MIACKDCRCWKRLDDKTGECRMSPPAVMIVDGELTNIRPSTAPDDGCDFGVERIGEP
ncbi:MAG: hypothetical protein HY323_07135 [Betaproteobacteria bacterium]|nr:hypothetical protein [Betaproteobacteria bacterium]